MTAKKLPIEDLVLDERMQARAALDPSAVDDYAAAYQAKAELPPVDVFLVDGVSYVVDGWHRIAGARAAGVSFLRHVVVGTGSIDEAIWRALASNRAHGVRRSNADKRRAVWLALESAIGGEQSSRMLAEHLGVSHDLVSRLRAEWESARRGVEAEDVSSDDTSLGAGDVQTVSTSPEKRRDSVGRMQPARKPKSRVVLDDGARSTSSTSDEDAGGFDQDVAEALLEDIRSLAPWPPAVEDVPPLPHEIEASPAAAPALPSYGGELERVAAAIARVRVEARRAELPTTFAQAVESGLQSVESALRYAVPEVCPRCEGARCMHCRDRGWVQRQEAEGLRRATA